MTHRTRIVLCGGVVALFFLVALGETTQLVAWTKGIQLNWNLFLGTVPSNAAPTDVAAIHMELKWHTFHDGQRDGSGWVGFTTQVIVSNTMNPYLSWARRDRTTDAALRHETYHFHLSDDYELRAVPFMDTVPRGVFATRAPKRPNPIGLSVVRLDRIEGGILYVDGVDIVDGTPLLDIKPYVPEFDNPTDVRTGWLKNARKTISDRRADNRFA